MRIRSFIAINLPREIKERLSQILAEVKKANSRAPIKWVEPRILHLTLHFLGGLDEKELDQTEEILARCIQDKVSFDMEIDQLGSFPDLASPRILFINCREAGGNKLVDLQTQIGRALKKSNFNVDSRPWQAHITFGRVHPVKSPPGRGAAKPQFNGVKMPSKIQFPKLELEGLKFKVKSIDLMKSDLFPDGPEYTVLKSFSLKPSL